MFQAHRLLHQSTLGLRVIRKKKQGLKIRAFVIRHSALRVRVLRLRFYIDRHSTRLTASKTSLGIPLSLLLSVMMSPEAEFRREREEGSKKGGERRALKKGERGGGFKKGERGGTWSATRRG